MAEAVTQACKPCKAVVKYLREYAEAESQALAGIEGRWRGVIIIPAFAEDYAGLKRVAASLTHADCLQIWVINAPVSADAGALAATQACLRRAQSEGRILWRHANVELLEIGGAAVLLVDRCAQETLIPKEQGVGLARKIGGDMALALIASGYLQTTWIHFTDADAELPADYFDQAAQADGGVALVYPFRHRGEGDARQQRLMRIYDNKLRSYVVGLQAAGSPYAYHTIGSTLACRADAYAMVRGMPLRAAGEDFYLLNKLAKLGPVLQPQGEAIVLSGRLSSRVPFGTGPALQTALEGEGAMAFYHPATYPCLHILLQSVAMLWRLREQPEASISKLAEALSAYTGRADLANQALEAFAVAGAVRRFAAQSSTEQVFRRHFHCWFDGFQTLKWIHWWRDNLYPSIYCEQDEQVRALMNEIEDKDEV
ncbi:hypothetical protein EUZ85_10700 [Hahella sp. KA22]|uniref:hypothetical protein n=1 Tax=Hahella sp. KA22 TaxID=1628392 RepID=UPI000FDD2B40|nr:hypothetical protein [Hahella sp. KA22]AZZ91171.1 hypothetical protein ENC22_08145 [Hahella sp. KA22]QAY54539.1 hypothetical protein EUZ85_10700 [Hahella sp. KA22]